MALKKTQPQKEADAEVTQQQAAKVKQDIANNAAAEKEAEEKEEAEKAAAEKTAEEERQLEEAKKKVKTAQVGELEKLAEQQKKDSAADLAKKQKKIKAEAGKNYSNTGKYTIMCPVTNMIFRPGVPVLIDETSDWMDAQIEAKILKKR